MKIYKFLGIFVLVLATQNALARDPVAIPVQQQDLLDAAPNELQKTPPLPKRQPELQVIEKEPTKKTESKTPIEKALDARDAMAKVLQEDDPSVERLEGILTKVPQEQKEYAVKTELTLTQETIDNLKENESVINNQSLLHLATSITQPSGPEIIRFLLDNGADPNIQQEVLKKSETGGTVIVSRETPLHTATKNSSKVSTDIIKALLNDTRTDPSLTNNPNDSAKSYKKEYVGLNPLHLIIWRGRDTLIRPVFERVSQASQLIKLISTKSSQGFRPYDMTYAQGLEPKIRETMRLSFLKNLVNTANLFEGSRREIWLAPLNRKNETLATLAIRLQQSLMTEQGRTDAQKMLESAAISRGEQNLDEKLGFEASAMYKEIFGKSIGETAVEFTKKQIPVAAEAVKSLAAQIGKSETFGKITKYLPWGKKKPKAIEPEKENPIADLASKLQDLSEKMKKLEAALKGIAPGA